MKDKDPKIKMVELSKLKPYENNPRDNTESIGKVAESIKKFGFLQPIVCDSDGVILAGHTRYKAAESLGLDNVPVLYADKLTPAEAKAYRLADNKVGEGSRWVNDLLAFELSDLDISDSLDMDSFGFDPSSEYKRREAWTVSAKLCEMRKKIMTREKMGFLYTNFFTTGKTGRPIDEIKSDNRMIEPFADNLVDYIYSLLGENISNKTWCLCTTPRRKHKDFHFATEVCKRAAEEMNLYFCEDAVVSNGRNRVHMDFELRHNPETENVILYDDIITTGLTIKETRNLLINAGHAALCVVAIRNQSIKGARTWGLKI